MRQPSLLSPRTVIALRWNHGGRNVPSATIQRGGKTTKSAAAVPGTSDGLVSTVKMLGSGWSNVTELTAAKRARSYLYGAPVPCHATTSKGECACAAAKHSPPNFATIIHGAATSSKAATG